MKSTCILPLTLLAALPCAAQENSTNAFAPAFNLQLPVLSQAALLPAVAAGTPVMSHVLPNPFLPVDPVPRKSVSDKFQKYFDETYGPKRQMTGVASIVFNQAIGGGEEWGSGAGGYTNRVSSQMAKHAVRNSIRFGFDAALGTDSYYRKSKSTGFASRLGHALLSTVTTYKDGGGRTIGIPQIAGAYGSAFAANLWYPNSRNSTNDALMRGTSTLAFSAGKNVLKEFWPEIKKLLGR